MSSATVMNSPFSFDSRLRAKCAAFSKFNVPQEIWWMLSGEDVMSEYLAAWSAREVEEQTKALVESSSRSRPENSTPYLSTLQAEAQRAALLTGGDPVQRLDVVGLRHFLQAYRAYDTEASKIINDPVNPGKITLFMIPSEIERACLMGDITSQDALEEQHHLIDSDRSLESSAVALHLATEIPSQWPDFRDDISKIVSWVRPVDLSLTLLGPEGGLYPLGTALRNGERDPPLLHNTLLTAICSLPSLVTCRLGWNEREHPATITVLIGSACPFSSPDLALPDDTIHLNTPIDPRPRSVTIAYLPISDAVWEYDSPVRARRWLARHSDQSGWAGRIQDLGAMLRTTLTPDSRATVVGGSPESGDDEEGGENGSKGVEENPSRPYWRPQYEDYAAWSSTEGKEQVAFARYLESRRHDVLD